MSVDTLRAAVPAYAKDISLNLSSLASETVLDDAEKWGCFLACALATGNAEVIQAIQAEAAQHLDDTAQDSVKAAAAIMAMNNVYYRTLHLMSDQTYATLPAKLRMNVLANPGAPKTQFELWSLAVSAMNGCGLCLDSHEKTLRQHEVANVKIQAAIRIAAVVNAAASVIAAERALNSPPASA